MCSIMLNGVFIVIVTFFTLLHSFHAHSEHVGCHLLFYGCAECCYPSGSGEPWRAFEQGYSIELGLGMINLAVGLSLIREVWLAEKGFIVSWDI